MCNCSDLNIPERLHKGEREEDNSFENEIIYRRFKAAGEREDWLQNNSLAAAIFTTNEVSCNRDKYSDSPEDVLYNTDCNKVEGCYDDYGIVCFNSNILNSFPTPVLVGQVERNFTLTIKHTPTDCMYPHSELFILEDGELINQDAPKSTRALIRTFLISNVEICKYPESSQ